MRPRLSLTPYPLELRRRVEVAIKALIDFGTWDHQVAIRKWSFRSIAEIAERMRTLPN